MKKKSQILHISVCGTYLRIWGRYQQVNNNFIGSVRKHIEYYNNNDNYWRWWENGAKHEARKLDFITADEWLLLN